MGKRSTPGSAEQWEDVRQILEQTSQEERPTEERPPEHQQGEELPSASGHAPPQTVDQGVGLGPLTADGVRLQTVYSAIRGLTGERTRDGQTSFDAKYQGKPVGTVLEEITTVATDPFRILEEFNANTYDQMLPQHAGADQEYIRRDGTLLEEFASRFRDRRTNARDVIHDRHLNLVPMKDFRYVPRKVRDGVVGDGTPSYLDA